jgi:CheY-like chemotaxis protein
MRMPLPMQGFEPGPPRKKILVVDDDPVVLATLSLKLGASGYQVLTAADGSEALAATRQEKPDLLLLDLSFPPNVGGVDWNGFLIARWIRRLDGAANLPIIMISGSNRSDYRKMALAEGILAFLRKPIDIDDLLATVSLALSKSPVAHASLRATSFEI